MTPTIGGVLDLQALAQLHRPRDPDAMHRAVLDLADRGYTDHTIATACALSVEIVRQLIGQRARS